VRLVYGLAAPYLTTSADFANLFNSDLFDKNQAPSCQISASGGPQKWIMQIGKKKKTELYALLGTGMLVLLWI